MAKILLVEDDPALRRNLSLLLKSEHHVVDTVVSGSDAVHQLSVSAYDLLVVDWQLPEMSGLDLCKRFRFEGGKTPILMLTGKDAVIDKIKGLDSGADDYVTKPFVADELMARIRALLRRQQGYSSNVLVAGNLTLDPESYSVTRDGEQIDLLPKEFALLEFFMRNPNRVFDADVLLDRVWSAEVGTSPQTVRTHMQRLRSKIDTEGQPSILQTLRGVGYRLKLK